MLLFSKFSISALGARALPERAARSLGSYTRKGSWSLERQTPAHQPEISTAEKVQVCDAEPPRKLTDASNVLYPAGAGFSHEAERRARDKRLRAFCG